MDKNGFVAFLYEYRFYQPLFTNVSGWCNIEV